MFSQAVGFLFVWGVLFFCFVLFLLDDPERPVVVVKAKPDFQQLV